MIPDIVKRALLETITDIGQLNDTDKKILNKYVTLGYLDKGKGGPFPKVKTVYAHKGFDFNKQREDYINDLFELCKRFGEKVTLKFEGE